jgi:ATP-binding protein involved in chromosome partitioning
MASLSQETVLQKLSSFHEDYLNTDLATAKVIPVVSVQDNRINIHLEFGFPTKWVADEIASKIREFLSPFDPSAKINVQITDKIYPYKTQANLQPHPQIKNIIAVASGKGGVGKSTTAANLALALQALGARVGVLDADIYGPNQPHMLGAQSKPELTEDKKLMPVMCFGLETMSIGYLVDVETPMIWRGPMVSTALQQLLRDTRWDNLDYLIVDLPPGTGDIQLTLSQKIPVSGSVIVTTPQDIALLDARKALEMFRKVNVPVLGIIENMSSYVCTKCGNEEALFGENGGEQMAQDFHVDLLGKLPLMLAIRKAVDEGKPTVVSDPDSVVAKKYLEIALKMAARLSLQTRNFADKFGKIVVE